jgi:site-specific DNA-methyltransferase (adenine-specific)
VPTRARYAPGSIATLGVLEEIVLAPRREQRLPRPLVDHVVEAAAGTSAGRRRGSWSRRTRTRGTARRRPGSSSPGSWRCASRTAGAPWSAIRPRRAPAGRGGTVPAVNQVRLGDNLDVLRELADGSVDMVYADPPFNTGRTQTRRTLAIERTGADDGDRTGFKGRRYASTVVAESSYADAFEDYLGFLEPRLRELHRVLAPHGTLYLHLDYREAHATKLRLDELFGPACFLNELIWAYDYGAKPRTRWPQKHDTILVYVKDRARYHFDAEAVDREPYMAPGLVTPEQRERGKRPTSVMWHTIVSPTGREKTGYPTQKPEALVRRFVQASSRPGDLCLDPFAGSGTLGSVAAALGRRFLLIDSSGEAVAVMRRRLAAALTAAG